MSSRRKFGSTNDRNLSASISKFLKNSASLKLKPRKWSSKSPPRIPLSNQGHQPPVLTSSTVSPYRLSPHTTVYIHSKDDDNDSPSSPIQKPDGIRNLPGTSAAGTKRGSITPQRANEKLQVDDDSSAEHSADNYQTPDGCNDERVPPDPTGTPRRAPPDPTGTPRRAPQDPTGARRRAPPGRKSSANENSELMPIREETQEEYDHELYFTSPRVFRPKLYTFKYPLNAFPKDPFHVLAPPFWVLVDHLIAVVWYLYSGEKREKVLSICSGR